MDHSRFHPCFSLDSLVSWGDRGRGGGYSMSCLEVTGCKSSIVPDPRRTARGGQGGSEGVKRRWCGMNSKHLTLIRDRRWVKSHPDMSNMAGRSGALSTPAQQSIPPHGCS